ncbi:MAG: hypothetical protein WAR37_04960 [Candidatus Microsaccharimonas sp.]
MKEPLYKPETWVIFQHGDARGFGKIVGGHTDSSEWIYSIEGSATNSEARQSEITHYFQNGNWSTPNTTNNASAYSDISAA